jgi:hypothetical protein
MRMRVGSERSGKHPRGVGSNSKKDKNQDTRRSRGKVYEG